MTSLNATLRGQLLEMGQKLLASSTNSADAVASTAMKEELSQILSMIALLQEDVRGPTEQVADLHSSNHAAPSSLDAALVAQAVPALPSSPVPAPIESLANSPLLPTFPLPNELLARIISFIDPLDYSTTLTPFALVSRNCYRASKPFVDSVLSITDAKQFRSLSKELDEGTLKLSSIKYLALAFKMDELALTPASDRTGQTWLAPLALDVLQNLQDVKLLGIGPQLLGDWATYRELLDSEDGLFTYLAQRTGVRFDKVRGQGRRLRLCWTGFAPVLFEHLQECMENSWKGWDEYEIACEPTRSLPHSLTGRARMYTAHLHTFRTFLAPHVLSSVDELLWLFPSIEPPNLSRNLTPSIERLEITLYVAKEDDYDELVVKITELFARLAPTLRHLHLRLRTNARNDSLGLSDLIYTLIPTLPHLTSLGIGGDIALGEDDSHQFMSFASVLCHLPLTNLHLFISCCPPFSRWNRSNGLIEELEKTDEEGKGFAKLRRVVLEYRNEVVEHLPVRLPRVCWERGIELCLRKML